MQLIDNYGCTCYSSGADDDCAKHPSPKQAYKPVEVAEMLGVTEPTVRKMFAKEKGVIILERPETMNKRRYQSMRIPRAVLERVLRGLTVK